jgi:hypothetical protein
MDHGYIFIPDALLNMSGYLSVYYRPTDLLPLPLLISAVSLDYKQNNAWLNFGPPAAQSAPPQLKVFPLNSPFCSNFVSQLNYRNPVMVCCQLYAKDHHRDELIMEPGNGPYC